MNLIYIETLFLLFLIYSFTGWLIETIGDLIKHKKFINRGFLLGPYCPIYGTGVILITLFLSKYTDDLFALFFLSMMLCGLLEYCTSYIMEKVFKARWWDYSNMRFNINGRICLETLILFGIAGVLILHYLNPFLSSIITKLPDIHLHIISGLLFFIFVVDCTLSLKIINSVKSIKISVSNQIKDNTDEISSKVREIIMKKSAPYRRLIAAFPQAFADKLKESKEKLEKTAEKVKENLHDVKEKTLDNIQDVKENLQDIKEKTLDNIQNVKDKVSDNIQIIKDKTLNNIQEVKDKVSDNIKNIKDKTK
ncbi:MAG: hypothetical protein J6C46_02600 [Clostridia bacterium]|nr:hypothetical protein [Clostridia bacterium]